MCVWSLFPRLVLRTELKLDTLSHAVPQRHGPSRSHTAPSMPPPRWATLVERLVRVGPWMWAVLHLTVTAAPEALSSCSVAVVPGVGDKLEPLSPVAGGGAALRATWQAPARRTGCLLWSARFARPDHPSHFTFFSKYNLLNGLSMESPPPWLVTC